ncbi:MAG: Gfo/Idh/MocA family oxidoreductase [Gemmatimonadetes bacterium]|nr:Gfo/Idh/MocA family oxidoreductase [Gemmatimonadota bacterium]
MIRVGLVGYGLGGKVFHAQLIQMAPDLELYAVCSRSLEKRQDAEADFPQIVTYDSFDALLTDDNIDLVVLATPHDTHAPMAIRAMDAGKHLVTDKIMCLNESEALAMIEASERNQVLLSVYQNRRWDGDFLTLQHILAEGILGDIYTIESNITTYGGPHVGWRAWKKYGGGRVLDWGAHLVDQALRLYGSTVETVFADLQYRYPKDKADVEALSLIHLRFANGVRYFIELGTAWMYAKPRYHVRGSLGSFRKYGIDPQEAAMKSGVFGVLVPEDPARYQLRVINDRGQTVEHPVSPLFGSYRTYYDNVGAALVHGEELLVKPEECLKAIRVIDAIRLSAEREEVVKLI